MWFYLSDNLPYLIERYSLKFTYLPVQGLAYLIEIEQTSLYADGLCLSLVHTNKTLRKLEKRGLHLINDGCLHMCDVKALARLADLYGDGRPPPRPLV